VLLALVASGMARDDAYRIVQRTAQQAWDSGTHLRELLAQEPAAAGLDLDELFDERWHVRHADAVIARLDELG